MKRDTSPNEKPVLPTILLHVRFTLPAAARKKPKMKELTPEEDRELQEAFNLFDSDSSGNIDMRELKTAMRALGFAVKKDDVKAIMREYDKDDSGSIEYLEFRDIMREKMGERNPDDELAKAFKVGVVATRSTNPIRSMRAVTECTAVVQLTLKLVSALCAVVTSDGPFVSHLFCFSKCNQRTPLRQGVRRRLVGENHGEESAAGGEGARGGCRR